MSVRYLPIDGEELAWLRGWLEGEGCFYAKIHSGSLKISVTAVSTDEETIRKVHALVGGTIGGPYKNGACKPHWKFHWRWGVHARKDVAHLMALLRPGMSSRRQGEIDAALALDAATPRRKEGRTCGRSGYMAGCRCEVCTEANRLHQVAYVAANRDAVNRRSRKRYAERRQAA